MSQLDRLNNLNGESLARLHTHPVAHALGQLLHTVSCSPARYEVPYTKEQRCALIVRGQKQQLSLKYSEWLDARLTVQLGIHTRGMELSGITWQSYHTDPCTIRLICDIATHVSWQGEGLGTILFDTTEPLLAHLVDRFGFYWNDKTVIAQIESYARTVDPAHPRKHWTDYQAKRLGFTQTADAVYQKVLRNSVTAV